MKPGELWEWQGTTTATTNDAVSPFLIIKLDRDEVQVLDQKGKLHWYVEKVVSRLASQIKEHNSEGG